MVPDFKTAMVRAIPKSYRMYNKPDRPMSLELAVWQHQNYVNVLEQCGLEVRWVEADENQYDCVFIEDTAVVWENQALITRMTPRREGEKPPVAKLLSEYHQLHKCSAGSLLEGGDVLHVGSITYVGLSGRTNIAGVSDLRNFLSAFGRRVVSIPVVNCLHLKSGATYLGNGVLLAAPDLIDTRKFEVEDVLFTHPEEKGAANCIRIGNFLLILGGYPFTEEKLRKFAEQHGAEIITLDVSELEKGKGSLTCLSLRW